MYDKKLIEEATKRLVDTYKPLKIYIFGSYAWGCPDDDSDLDFAIIIDKFKDTHHKTLVDGHKALIDLKISKDLIVYETLDFEKRAEHQSSLCHKIKEEGKIVYTTKESVKLSQL